MNRDVEHSSRIKEWLQYHCTPNSNTLKLLKLALPVVSSLLLQMAYNIVDLFWVGKIGNGSDAVAAVGAVGFFMHLGLAIFSIVTMGVTIRVSQAVGQKDDSKLGTYSIAGVILGGIIAVIYISVQLIFADDLLSLLGIKEQSIMEEAISYMNIVAIGGVTFFARHLLVSIVNAQGFTKLSFKAALYGNIVNIILDPIFIFSFGWGIQGAAWATVIAWIVSFVYVVIVMRKQKLLTFESKYLNMGIFTDLLKVGGASATQRILFTLIAIGMGYIVTSYGSYALAAQKLGLQIESLTFMAVGGLQQALSIMVGQMYGAKRYKEIGQLYLSTLKMGVTYSTITTIFFFIFASGLIRLFVNEDQTIAIGRDYLIIVGLSQIFMASEMIAGGVFNGLGLTHYSASISVVFNVMRIPLALLLCSTELGLMGVWWSISATTMGKGITAYIMYRFRYRKLMRTVKNDLI